MTDFDFSPLTKAITRLDGELTRYQTDITVLPWKIDIVDWAITSEPFRTIIQKEFEVIR